MSYRISCVFLCQNTHSERKEGVSKFSLKARQYFGFAGHMVSANYSVLLEGESTFDITNGPGSVTIKLYMPEQIWPEGPSLPTLDLGLCV